MQYFGFDRPSFEFRTFGFGANFDPLDLFSGGKQGVWYDPSDKSTLFQDVEGTVPVTKDGDPVALMKDKSGNGNNAVQTTSTARPIYKTDGILHWLSFDGIDDSLTIPAGFFNPLKQQLLIGAYDVLAHWIFGCIIGSTGTFIKVDLGGDDSAIYPRSVTYASGGTAVVSSTASVALREPFVQTVSYNNVTGASTSSTNRKNLISTTTTSGNLVGGKTIAIGRDESITIRNVAMNFYGVVMLSHDGVDKADAEQYLANKSGVTL